MVQVEGRGLVAPSPYKLTLTDSEMRQLIYYARQRDTIRRYADRVDVWGRGMVGAFVIPNVGAVEESFAPTLAGLVGEYGVATFLNRRCGDVCRIDTDLRRFGDGGIDLSPRGLKIDVKTRLKDYGSHLVRSRRDDGSVVDWQCQVFAFCQWGKFKTVEMHGFAWARDVNLQPEVAARRGVHKNKEVTPELLLPMSRLVDEIRSRE